MKRIMNIVRERLSKANDVKNAVKIINYFLRKNIDLRKGLRTGMYGNKTLTSIR